MEYRKGCFVSRLGAYGDLLYALPALEMLKRDYGYLHLDTGPQGALLFGGNETFDKVTLLDIRSVPPEHRGMVYSARTGGLEDADWDKFVSLWRTLEVECIAEMHQQEFFLPRERRMKLFGTKNFHDEILKRCGYEAGILKEYGCGTFEFSDEEMEYMDVFNRKHEEKFKVVISLCGSTGQKVPQMLPEIAKMIDEKYDDAVFILIGDKEAQQLTFTLGKKNVLDLTGKTPFRQSICLVRMADYVIGPETSMLVAAGMFGIPKTMMLSSASVWQACGYHRNDFSIQSTVSCSPCFRAIYNWNEKQNPQSFCNQRDSWLGEIPECNFLYETDRLMEGVQFGCDMRGVRKNHDNLQLKRVTTLPELRSLSVLPFCRSREV